MPQYRLRGPPTGTDLGLQNEKGRNRGSALRQLLCYQVYYLAGATGAATGAWGTKAANGFAMVP